MKKSPFFGNFIDISQRMDTSSLPIVMDHNRYDKYMKIDSDSSYGVVRNDFDSYPTDSHHHICIHRMCSG